MSDAALQEALQSGILEMAEELTVEAGCASVYKDRVYSALLRHISQRFLNGTSIRLADRVDVEYAFKMLRQVKSKTGAIPGLIAGIIEYGN